MSSEQRSAVAWLYDDLLAWLSPGGLLLTALALRYPLGLQLLRDQRAQLSIWRRLQVIEPGRHAGAQKNMMPAAASSGSGFRKDRLS